MPFPLYFGRFVPPAAQGPARQLWLQARECGEASLIPLIIMVPELAPPFDQDAVVSALLDPDQQPVELASFRFQNVTLPDWKRVGLPNPNALEPEPACETADAIAQECVDSLPQSKSPAFAESISMIRTRTPWLLLHQKLLTALRRRWRPGPETDDLALAERAIRLEVPLSLRKRGRPRGASAFPDPELALYELALFLRDRQHGSQSAPASRLLARVRATQPNLPDPMAVRHALQRQRQWLRKHRIVPVGLEFPGSPLPHPTAARKIAVSDLASHGLAPFPDRLVHEALWDWACAHAFGRCLRVVTHGSKMHFNWDELPAPAEALNSPRRPAWRSDWD